MRGRHIRSGVIVLALLLAGGGAASRAVAGTDSAPAPRPAAPVRAASAPSAAPGGGPRTHPGRVRVVTRSGRGYRLSAWTNLATPYPAIRRIAPAP